MIDAVTQPSIVCADRHWILAAVGCYCWAIGHYGLGIEVTSFYYTVSTSVTKFLNTHSITVTVTVIELHSSTKKELFSEESCSVHVGLSKQVRLQLRPKLLATVVW